MKKMDWAVTAEIAGVTLFAIGVAMFSLPLALMAIGAFLVWATEK